MRTETELASDEQVENKGRRIIWRKPAKLWVAVGLAGIVLVGAWLKYSPGASGSSAAAPPATLPQVMVSKPLAQDIDTRLGFLGQFAAVEEAKARIRDAQFHLDHCRITAPFTGRMGTHLVSVGNLIAGSRTATSPTTLLATLVSLDPIYLDFDMSESDFLTYSKYRGHLKGGQVQRVEVALGDDNQYARSGVFDFLDNVLDRSSGTIHARATVANSNLVLTPGLFARVRLVVAPPSPTLLVPDSAVLPDQSQHMVMTVSADGTVAPKRVEIGEIRGGFRVIRSGLAPSERVIVDGLLHVAPGTKVGTQDGTIRYVGGQD